MKKDTDEPNPIALFTRWFEEAKAHPAISEPTAMALATATPDGAPSNRIVLLKAQTEERFTFFTNYDGRKSGELEHNPQAALCFYWMALDKQLRIEGAITRASEAESDAYFASRPRRSQLGAWASQQSQPMDHFEQLEENLTQYEAEFEGKDVPRPPHWGGWILTANRMEFWQQEANRLHQRWLYEKQDENWVKSWLYP